MSKETMRKVIIGLETAINGGSLSLIEEGREIDNFIGTGVLLRSDSILENLDMLLDKNNISRNEIEKICVSNGPGSLTGIRIGMALALGIGNALKKEVVELSIFEAMCVKSSFNNNVITAFQNLAGDVFYNGYGEYDADIVFGQKVEKKMSYLDFIYKIFLYARQYELTVILTFELARLLEETLSSIDKDQFKNLKIIQIEGSYANIIATASGYDQQRV